MGWKQYGKEATEERENGIPLRSIRSLRNAGAEDAETAGEKAGVKVASCERCLV